VTMKLISNSAQLRTFIDKLHEAPAAPAPAAPPPAPPAPTDEAAQTPEQQGVSLSNVAGEQPAGQKQQKITLAMIIEKLNSIRSGHSLKDADILQQMQQYFHDLNDTERLALYAFLKGIAQVVTGEISGKAATGPSDAPPAVEMQPAGAAPAAPAPAPKTEAPAPAQAMPAAQATPPVTEPATPPAPKSNQKVRTIKPTIVRRAPTPIQPKAR
jgi:pyruvate dehydrogenase E2 component (dihydrolipoamide acetyltransferase)